jgi:hypothetical protein
MIKLVRPRGKVSLLNPFECSGKWTLGRYFIRPYTIYNRDSEEGIVPIVYHCKFSSLLKLKGLKQTFYFP